MLHLSTHSQKFHGTPDKSRRPADGDLQSQRARAVPRRVSGREDLRGLLPEGTASRSDAASAAVDGLIRRGHADKEYLWALLAEHRPNERRKIEETRCRYREWTRQSSLGVCAVAGAAIHGELPGGERGSVLGMTVRDVSVDSVGPSMINKLVFGDCTTCRAGAALTALAGPANQGLGLR